MGRAKRTQRDHKRVRAEVAEAAAVVFARHGYAGSTVQHIATEVGCSVPTLYAYFKGKEEILKALVETLMADGLATLQRSYPSGLTLAQSLELMLSAHLEFIERRIAALIVLTRLPDNWEHEKACQSDFITALADWLSAHAKLVGPAAHEAAWMLAGLIHGVVSSWLHTEKTTPLTARAEPVTRFFLAGLEVLS